VVIVGGGLAGLHAAYRLTRWGVRVVLCEASERVGGRVQTERSRFDQAGLIAELGGEFVDSDHETTHALARELGLELADLSAATRGLRSETYFFGERLVTERDVVSAFAALAPALEQAQARAESSAEALAELDRVSIAEWLDRQPEASPLIRSLLNVAYLGEYGLPTEEQSLMNLLWLIDASDLDPFRIYGDSDERFHVQLGSESLAERLAAALPSGMVESGMRLVALEERSNGQYRLTFERGKSRIERLTSHVVLALPFTLLRQVELRLELPARKRTVISELGYGSNSKLHVLTRERVWAVRHKAAGSAFTDNGAQTLWDGARGQASESGLLTVFLGGSAADQLGRASLEADVSRYVPLAEQVFPGVADAALTTGPLSLPARSVWSRAPFALGSYACYRPGQAQWSGVEGERVRRVYFCGEHTSVDFQGYMEGALETGMRAALEVARDLGVRVPTAARTSTSHRSAPRRSNGVTQGA
jgi:monoamine oxidase